jgi:hypothetical protein
MERTIAIIIAIACTLFSLLFIFGPTDFHFGFGLVFGLMSLEQLPKIRK